MNFLQRIFDEKLVDDGEINHPLFTFQLSSSVLGVDDLYGGFFPSVGFYYQLVALLIIQTLMAAAAGVTIYYFVIQKQNQNSLSSSTTPILAAFGIVFPFIILEPIYLIQYLSIQNLGLRMMVLALPCTTTLRCLEAFFGFTPLAAKKSLKNYLIYSSCLMGIKFDPTHLEPTPITSTFLKVQFTKLGRDYLSVVALMTVLKPRNFEFFQVEINAESIDHGLLDLISWRHLVNNYLVALLLSTSLSQSTLGVSIMYNICYGYQTTEVVLNPLLKSSSPSDFWGRRWNTLIHSGLKNAIYKPMRFYFRTSTYVAVLATFTASGILHEYVNFVLFTSVGILFRWKNIIFFGWNGFLIVSEYVFGQLAIFQWLSKKLPQLFITLLVVMTSLPLAHLFIGDWIQAGYFDHVNMCLPSIRKISLQ